MVEPASTETVCGCNISKLHVYNSMHHQGKCNDWETKMTNDRLSEQQYNSRPFVIVLDSQWSHQKFIFHVFSSCPYSCTHEICAHAQHTAQKSASVAIGVASLMQCCQSSRNGFQQVDVIVVNNPSSDGV